MDVIGKQQLKQSNQEAATEASKSSELKLPVEVVNTQITAVEYTHGLPVRQKITECRAEFTDYCLHYTGKKLNKYLISTALFL